MRFLVRYLVPTIAKARADAHVWVGCIDRRLVERSIAPFELAKYRTAKQPAPWSNSNELAFTKARGGSH